MTTTAPATTATQQGIPERTNVAAQISLLTALIGFAPAAVIFGIMSVRELDRRPHETGGWAAIAAITLGLVEIAAVVLVLLFANIELPRNY